MNLTLITAFKKFKGVSDMIQKSALFSWQANGLEVVVPNNELYIKEGCSGYSNVRVIEGVKRGSDYGFSTHTPVLRSMLEKALPAVKTPMVAFLNADIILPEDFSSKCDAIFKKYGFDIFLAGHRHDLKLNFQIGDSKTYSKAFLEKSSLNKGKFDLFITSKFQWRKILKDMPEFLMGRLYWENWLHSYVTGCNFKRYDCSQALKILHGIHDYGFIKRSEGAVGKDAPSAKFNFSLLKSPEKTPKYWPPVEI